MQDNEAIETAEAAETAGSNPRKVDKRFPVIELFGPVIQGEGSQAGQQTLFIRFGGCDFRCTKCDSMHAVEPKAVKKHATYMTAEEIAKWCHEEQRKTGVIWVTFSGGNPAMHDLTMLVALLKTMHFCINVETQGSLWQPWFNYANQLTISPKSPGMGEEFNPQKLARILSLTTEYLPVCIKVVVFSPRDFEFALMVEDLCRDFPHRFTYYLSVGNPHPPVLNEDLDLVDAEGVGPQTLKLLLLDDYRIMSEEVLEDPRLKAWRFLPQLHVLTYGNESKR